MIIAHRGNLNGPSERENTPDYILEAIQLGFDVEVDVWVTDGVYLGHDRPETKIDIDFLKRHSDRLWCHAKNLNALHVLLRIGLHTFWHDTDDYVLTSRGVIWAYPGKDPQGAIAVMPARGSDISGAIGVCTDYALEKW